MGTHSWFFIKRWIYRRATSRFRLRRSMIPFLLVVLALLLSILLSTDDDNADDVLAHTLSAPPVSASHSINACINFTSTQKKIAIKRTIISWAASRSPKLSALGKDRNNWTSWRHAVAIATCWPSCWLSWPLRSESLCILSMI
jgi:hypothetical protein